MLGLFEGIFPGPEKNRKCIRKVKKYDGVSEDEVPCIGDVWPEPEIEAKDGKEELVYYCTLHREHTYTKKEYDKLIPPK